MCSANKGSSLMLQAQTPSVSTVGPEPSPNASAPAIATNFRMLVERKIREVKPLHNFYQSSRTAQTISLSL